MGKSVESIADYLAEKRKELNFGGKIDAGNYFGSRNGEKIKRIY